jgi:hypothetical protein
MTTRIDKYEINCVETGRGTHGSIYVCSVVDKEMNREVETINFRIRRKPSKNIIVESSEAFRKAFDEVFGNIKPDVFVKRSSRSIAGCLEFIILKIIVEKGLWKP